MHSADWHWVKQVKRAIRGYYPANQCQVPTQCGAYIESLDLHVPQTSSLKFSCQQGRVVCVYDNWQSVFKIRPIPSTYSAVMATVLQIPNKNCNIPQTWLNKQRQINRELLNGILRPVLQPLTFRQYSSSKTRWLHILCADGNFRHCKSAFAVWLQNCP
jgi:hypothetical protein